MDAKTLIDRINNMPLSDDEKQPMLDDLNARGDEAVADVVTLLDLKARNADLAAELLSDVGNQTSDELEQAANDAVGSGAAPAEMAPDMPEPAAMEVPAPLAA